MSRLLNAITIARQQGTKWVFFRLLYAAQLKFGIVSRRLPRFEWSDRPLESWLRKEVPSSPEAYSQWRCLHPSKFFFSETVSDFPKWFDAGPAVSAADQIIAGRWPYYGYAEFEVGFPPDWRLNPATGECIISNRHWSSIGEFDHGDIKFVWEASRFGVVYPLARAYAATGDERYPAAFWTLIEDWARHNPPQAGPNWKCGQEAAIRVMAWCFGWFAFQSSPHSTPQCRAQLAAMLAVHADRIEGNIAYALSQNNNHGLSEAAALWTVGLLWPEFADSERWRRRSKQLLEEQIQRQIADDGTYVQHSTNYHRLMLHLLLWSFRLGELNGERFSQTAYDRLVSAVDFLASIIDPESGRAPNHGSNDGALVLPLNGCDYTDYRPVLQATSYLLHQKRLFPSGPWDEDLLWMFGRDALQSSQVSEPAIRSAFPDGGYYLLRGADSWGMVRCARYHTRPAHADQLHFDLWWRGINIATDAGTYLYNGDPPWRNGLAGSSVHNTVTVDGLDQMTRASLFLWIDWSEGKVRKAQADGRQFWEGEHNGYQSRLGVLHRRTILLTGNTWIVVDSILGGGEHRARLHWLLPYIPYHIENSRIELQTDCGIFAVQSLCSCETAISLVRGGRAVVGEDDNDRIRGWHSRYYGSKDPALSFALDARSPLPLRFVTIFSADAALQRATSEEFLVHASEGEIRIPMTGEVIP